MTRPLWVMDAAEAFWRAAGEAEPFPRDLRRPLAYALPVGLVLLPRLRLRAVDDWLRHQQIRCVLDLGDRALRACLIARQGQGVIFIDGGDPPDEQRFSLAHELGHYLREYWLPRGEASARLGPAILDVLDGRRAPQRDERIDALLARIELGYHVHLLDRAPDGGPKDATVTRAEHEADLLAYELLAPATAVLRDLPDDPRSSRVAATDRLHRHYGLPVAQASRYAALLVPPPATSDGLLRRLGLVP